MNTALYYAGGRATYYTRGDSVSSDLYYSGGSETFIKQGTKCTEALYKQGNYYFGGLYHSYQKSSVQNAKLVPAVVGTKSIKALTKP